MLVSEKFSLNSRIVIMERVLSHNVPFQSIYCLFTYLACLGLGCKNKEIVV